MVLTSRKNRKYSDADFNRELILCANKGKLVESKIVEPLKFGASSKLKTPKNQDLNGKLVFGEPNSDAEKTSRDSNESNKINLLPNPEHFLKVGCPSPKLTFTFSPKKVPEKVERAPRKSMTEYFPVCGKESSEEELSPTLHSHSRLKFGFLKQLSCNSGGATEKQECLPNLTLTTSIKSSDNDSGFKKKMFGSNYGTQFFKKLSMDEKLADNSPSRKTKETDTKDDSSCDRTPGESLRNSINSLSKEDFFFGKRLGRGKFGEVFLVKHKEIGFLSALKIISKKTILS